MNKSSTRPPSILVADDDELILEFISEVLQEDGYSITQYNGSSLDENVLKKEYDVAILDIVMPGKDGFELREEILKNSPGTQFVFITGHASYDKLNKIIDLGVYGFLPKPFGSHHIRYAVLSALRVKEIYQQNLEYKVSQSSMCDNLVGISEHIKFLRRRIVQLAPLGVSVLITGESGTGKEVVANCIHKHSSRVAKPFIAVNCASLPPSLIESELFGHAQGAFTGAIKTKQGFFEVAKGGTIFLDEIGELALEMQAKLLRVLDKGEFCRVGDPVPRKSDARVISATNQNLEEMIEKGQFRKDLYYRLRGSQIKLTPLNERREDIPFLVYHFLGKDKIITPNAMNLLKQFSWHGNIRELSLFVKNLVDLGVGEIITEETINDILSIEGKPILKNKTELTYKKFKEQILRKYEKDYFKSIMEKSNNNITKTADKTGMSRKNLRDKLKQLGVYKSQV